MMNPDPDVNPAVSVCLQLVHLSEESHCKYSSSDKTHDHMLSTDKEQYIKDELEYDFLSSL